MTNLKENNEELERALMILKQTGLVEEGKCPMELAGLEVKLEDGTKRPVNITDIKLITTFGGTD